MTAQKEGKHFTRSFTHLLKRAVQFSAYLYMEDVGKTGLTHRQFIVLAAVDQNEGKSQSELVKLTGIDRSTLADVVARLMAQGYLQRKRSKEDARTNAVRLTPVGNKMLKTARSGAEDIDKRLLAHFAAPDRKRVLECLSLLAAEMDQIDAVVPEAVEVKPKVKRKLAA